MNKILHLAFFDFELFQFKGILVMFFKIWVISFQRLFLPNQAFPLSPHLQCWGILLWFIFRYKKPDSTLKRRGKGVIENKISFCGLFSVSFDNNSVEECRSLQDSRPLLTSGLLFWKASLKSGFRGRSEESWCCLERFDFGANSRRQKYRSRSALLVYPSSYSIWLHINFL